MRSKRPPFSPATLLTPTRVGIAPVGRALALVCAAAASSPGAADAAEITDVVDAFDVPNSNPFDFHLEPSFRQRVERGTVVREAGCDPAEDPEECSVESTVFRREVDYRRVVNQFDFELEIGLFHDLELHLTLPIVISDRTNLEYADGVGPTQSNVDPSDDRVQGDLEDGGTPDGGATDLFSTYRYFDLPFDGPKRSGFGDMTVGVSWSPYNDSRDASHANLAFNLDYVAPTGKVREGDNTGVGRGVHELHVDLLASRKYRDIVEPYFGFRFAMPFAAKKGLFDSTANSTHRAPGFRFDTSVGTEIVIADDPVRKYHYSFDAGFDFGYTLEGRDYSPLSDALSGSGCGGLTAAEAGFADGPDGNAYSPDPEDVTAENAACAWVVQQPGNANELVDERAGRITYQHDGITDYEGFGRLGGHTAVNLQFSRYVELRIRAAFNWRTPYFITAADAGRDGDGDDTIELDPTPRDGNVERNPNYNLTLDAVGRRFRLENTFDVAWDATVAFQF